MYMGLLRIPIGRLRRQGSLTPEALAIGQARINKSEDQGPASCSAPAGRHRPPVLGLAPMGAVGADRAQSAPAGHSTVKFMALGP